jgi:signal peptidase I
LVVFHKKSSKDRKGDRHKKFSAANALKSVWRFIWEEDSFASWVVNIILAFLIIKFIFYPGIGLVLGTNHPIVAVISESMEHRTNSACMSVDANHKCTAYYPNTYVICNKVFTSNQKVDFNLFWQSCGYFYDKFNITKEDFQKFRFSNGFNKGDLMILSGKKPSEIIPGDIVVYTAGSYEPIIHRVVGKSSVQLENGTFKYYFTTKGDHNSDSILQDINFSEEKVLGVGLARVPLLGYVKIWFVDYIVKPLVTLITSKAQ